MHCNKSITKTIKLGNDNFYFNLNFIVLSFSEKHLNHVIQMFRLVSNFYQIKNI
jgi:hypothetical protein